MVIDKNKKISSIEYNHLNLPTRIIFDDPSTYLSAIDYKYDALGTKLEKAVAIYYQEGAPFPSYYVGTEYAGNYVYQKTFGQPVLQFFNHPEGYVELDGNNFNYIYQYKDHLGNVRLSYRDADGNGSITAATEVLEENNYYPFGGKHRGYNTAVNSTNIALKRKFGGKEYQDELGLDWYDISARNYDPALGRWMNIDPLAEDMTRHSPYNYAFDNPIYYIDPDGMSPFDNFLIHEDGSILRQKTDDKTDTFTYVKNDGTKHEIGTYEKNKKGLIQTPNIDYKDGDTSVKISTKAKNKSRSYISGTALASMIGASADSGQEISVVSVSNADGSSPKPSTSPINGKNADIRFAGKDGARSPINFKGSEKQFNKIDQKASASMNAGLKKFGYKSIKASKLTVQVGTASKTQTTKTLSVSGTTHLDDHFDHEHLQGYRPNVTTRDYAKSVSSITAQGIQF